MSGTEAAAFTLHEYVGLAAMAIIALFWLWMLVRRQGTSLGVLFPWFSRQRLASLQEDVRLHIRCAMRLALPDPEHSVALSSAIQGVGLVLALIMATTGTIGYFAWTEGTAMTGLAGAVFEVHGTLANVMWGYLIVHVGAALLHELFGHRILYQMSPSRTPERAPAAGLGDAPKPLAAAEASPIPGRLTSRTPQIPDWPGETPQRR